MNKRSAVWALGAGAVFAFTPMLIERLTDPNPWRTGAAIFMLPGVAVGYVLAGGIIHWIGWQVIIAVNFAFYSTLAYLILAIRGRVQKGARPPGTHSQPS